LIRWILFNQWGKRTLLHLVTFRLGREEYGVEIAGVQEIIRAVDIAPVPGAPSHIRGVINLRGKIIPVVDLGKRFAPATGGAADARRIVVAEVGEKRTGMLVDSVSRVIRIPAGVVENVIRVVGKLDTRLIIILDLNRSLLLT
jgi:purine-binding chemotaxis protein CheW